MNVLLVEDHSLFALGLEQMLREHFSEIVLNHFKSSKLFFECNQSLDDVDLIISDIELADGSDIFKFFEWVINQKSVPPILVLTMHNKLSIIHKCKQMGIAGYVLKDENVVLEAIKSLLSGREYYSDKAKETLSIYADNEAPKLSPREEEILKLIAAGKKNSEIAEILFVSLNTVGTHRKNIHRKLDLTNAAEITKYYYENYLSK